MLFAFEVSRVAAHRLRPDQGGLMGSSRIRNRGVRPGRRPAPAWDRWRRVTRVRALALTAAVGVLAGGCGGGGGGADGVASPSSTGRVERAARTTTTTAGSETASGSSPSTTSVAPTSAPDIAGGHPVELDSEVDPAKQEVIAAYARYWAVRLRANADTPNPDDPAFASVATGEQLATVIAETTRFRDQGVHMVPRSGAANLWSVRVVSLDGDAATVQECVVDDVMLVDRSTGSTVDDRIATHSVRGDLVKVDGAWKVSRAVLLQRWEGVAGCAVTP